ncbi:LysR family transcriptional regulator [Roseobacter ponti]|nr:LysR family transcriptional regulator [Roseobacter ponti]
MKHLNLNALRVFTIVARHGNLRHAANELNISRGAVSQRIRQLETDLGVALLVRQARGVSLTTEGERWQAAADDALAILETAFAGSAEADDSVTFHLGSSTASKWLMPRMNRFAARFPDISLRTEVHERMLSRSLGRNEIAIWPGSSPDPDRAHNSRPLTDIRLVAVCSPDFPRPESPLGTDTLLTLPLLQDAHLRWERLIGATGHSASHRLLNFDRSALALEAAIGGHGVAMAPDYMIADDLRAKRLVQIWASPVPSGEKLYVSWSRHHQGQRQTGRIADWIASEFDIEETLSPANKKLTDTSWSD